MNNVTYDTMPQAIGDMAKKLEKIEELFVNREPVKIDTSKKKYSLPEAAAYCCMAVPTFRTYIYKRKVAGTKFGKAWVFLEVDLDRFIEDYRVPTTSELTKVAFEKLTSSNKKYGKR